MKLASVLLFAISIGSCNPPHPSPQPPVPPPIGVKHVTVGAMDAQGQPIEGVLADLASNVGGPFTCLTDATGRCGWTDFPAPVVASQLGLTHSDYITVSVHVDLPRTDFDVPSEVMQLAFIPLPRLTIRGQFFQQADGTRWTAIEATDFNLYNRWLAGEDIQPVLQQRHDLGFNLLRVFTAYSVVGIGRLIPSEIAGYYERLPEFLRVLNNAGLYAELVAFTGPYGSFFPNEDAFVQHWTRLMTAVAESTNVLLELVNEFDNTPNLGVPYARLPRPFDTLASHGSAIADSIPKLPYWDYATYHPAFGPEWPRKAVHNGMEDVADPGKLPSLTNETTRFCDNDCSTTHAYDVGRGCALLQAGCDYHSTHGKNSTLWEGGELAAAQAWGQGAKSMPLTCQDGNYVHRSDLEKPGISRAYQRGNDPNCIALIRN